MNEEKGAHILSGKQPSTKPILVIDKSGVLGHKLTTLLSKHTLVIIVSRAGHSVADNVVSIPYHGDIPKIPDNDFSHIFLFFNGDKKDLQLLSPLAKKAHASGAKLQFVLPHKLATPRLLEKVGDTYARVQVFILGDIFGSSEIASPVQSMLHRAKVHGSVTLFQNGLIRRYPVFIDDVLSHLLSVADEKIISGKTYLLSMKMPIAEFTIARVLHQINPSILLQLHEHASEDEHTAINIRAEALLPKEYPLHERMKEAFRRISSNTQVSEKVTVSKKVMRSPKYISGLVLVLLSIGVCVMLSVLLPAVVGYISLTAAEKALGGGRMTEAKSYAATARTSFRIALTGSEVPFAIAERMGFEDAVGQGSRAIITGSVLASILSDSLQATELLSTVFAGESRDAKADFLQGISLAKHAALHMQQVSLSADLPEVVKRKVARYQEPAGLFAALSDSLPQLLGFDGEKTYLLLFQNNMELRPGGGFIGSYGLIPVKNGKLGEITIHDVYDADGQLKGHIDPPFPYRRYMGTNHWFLRDSNYAVDFAENASFAAYLLDLETKQRVDGVVAIDTNFIQTVLRIIGPVYVPDFQETITAENFVLVTQKHVETNFTEGSSQKKDFLRSLYNSISLKLSDQVVSFPDAVWDIYAAIKQKHTMFAASDKHIQQVFSANNLSAALPPVNNTKQEFNDMLAIVEANIGANKCNYYLRRSIRHEVQIAESGAYRGTLNLSYENTSQKTSPFGGMYKAYLRVFVPQELVLASVRVDGTERVIVPAVTNYAEYSQPSFVPPGGIEIETEIKDGRVSYGFYMDVTEQRKKTLTLMFQAPSVFGTTNAVFRYGYTLVKQPGTDRDPFSYSLILPQNFQGIGLEGDAALINKSTVVASGNLTEDQSFVIKAAKK